jgi:hypothetical protein
MKLNAKLLVWAGATLTILSATIGAAQSAGGYWANYFLGLGGAVGLSVFIAGVLQVDWTK